ncbi:transmembrane protein, putative [Medicago truncatula]|uniref:Transmembrane protein, putative n=1 Tax=Medicago truncatula TaxID=3880 RepID=A0A072TKC5_MEDTR|nr:transmembrane protein, putative [Medicago truncatula]
MSGLHRFKLLGIFLVSVGFLAILDGCPLLEFLDLHVCASLSQNLEQRCHEQIKDLRPPKHFLYYDDGEVKLAHPNWYRRELNLRHQEGAHFQVPSQYHEAICQIH